MFYRIIFLFFLIFSKSFTAPWTLSLEEKKCLEEKVQIAHQKRMFEIAPFADPYEVDGELRRLKFSKKKSSRFEKTIKDVEKKLENLGFYKKETPIAQKFGASLYFIEYFLENPKLESLYCEEILEEMIERDDFEERVYQLTFNQPSSYFTKEDPEKLIIEDPSSIKKFFQELIAKELKEYYYHIPTQKDKLYFDMASIYAGLQSFSKKFLLLTYLDPKSQVVGTVAVYVDPERPLLFNPDFGLFAYSNIETLTYSLAIGLQGKCFLSVYCF